MIKLDYQPMGFGLDEDSGLTNPQVGHLIGGENYELIFGEEGLRRINGYEVFDGRTQPHTASLSVITFASGTSAIAAGDTVTTPSGSAYVVRVQVNSGTWAGGNAAGSIVVTAVTGTISAAQVLSVGTPRATVSAFSASTIEDVNYAADIAAARNYYRGLIAKPPGEGPILGVKVWGSTVLALRNAAGGATATLWRSTAAGWVAVRTGLRPGGRMRAIVANFSGDAAEQALYVVDGKNRYFRVSQTWAVTFGPDVFDTEITSTTSLTPGTGTRVFNFTGTAKTWAAGQRVIAYSAANAANYMAGVVASSTASSVTVTVDAFGGVAAADWHLCREDGQDRPYIVSQHKDYLMLAYPRGQLQTSDVGDPMVVGAASDAFGVGDEIADLRGMRGDVLGIFTASGVSLLYGDGSTGKPWELRDHTGSNGCLRDGAQEIGGDAVYVSTAGVHTLSGTQAFGDFAYSNLSRKAQRSLRDVVRAFKCTALSRRDGQVRIYGADGAVLVMTVYGNPTPKSVRFTRVRYPHQPVCADGTMAADGDEIMVFGTEDGWVMRERVGTTFNGADILAFFRTSYWHAKMPQVRKRWRKLVLDVDTGLTPVGLMFRQDIDFSGPDQADAQNYTVAVGGGRFDSNYFDEFFFDGEAAAQVHASVDGIGRHMSLVVLSEGDTEPHIVRGIHMQFSPLTLQR